MAQQPAPSGEHLRRANSLLDATPEEFREAIAARAAGSWTASNQVLRLAEAMKSLDDAGIKRQPPLTLRSTDVPRNLALAIIGSGATITKVNDWAQNGQWPPMDILTTMCALRGMEAFTRSTQ